MKKGGSLHISEVVVRSVTWYASLQDWNKKIYRSCRSGQCKAKRVPLLFLFFKDAELYNLVCKNAVKSAKITYFMEKNMQIWVNSVNEGKKRKIKWKSSKKTWPCFSGITAILVLCVCIYSIMYCVK